MLKDLNSNTKRTTDVQWLKFVRVCISSNYYKSIWCFHAVRCNFKGARQQHLLFVVRHNYWEMSVKLRYACFTTLSGGRCPPHSPPAREITSPLTPEMPPSAVFIIKKINAVAVFKGVSCIDSQPWSVASYIWPWTVSTKPQVCFVRCCLNCYLPCRTVLLS